jgi:cytochrome b pre-mRNA-processing protein 3
MLKWFKRRSHLKRTAHNFYGSIVAASRQPEMFTQYAMPDTVEGRFELLVAHMFLVLERLRGEGESARPLAQALTDIFFADLDTSMRELGVGDMAVPKKMRQLAGVVHERLDGYRAALNASKPQELAMYIGGIPALGGGTDAAAPVAFAGYMRRMSSSLRDVPVMSSGEALPELSVLESKAQSKSTG